MAEKSAIKRDMHRQLEKLEKAGRGND